MENRFEIKLTRIDEKAVELNSMSAEALESFISVVASVRQVAESVIDKEDLIFSIESGSAVCSVQAPPESLETLHREIEIAMEGQSSNKGVTDGLRSIQREFKRGDLSYSFYYQKSTSAVGIGERLRSANRIGLKRVKRDYQYKLMASEGVIKQIGGENPNYHLTYQNGTSQVVACTEPQAMLVKQYLYEAFIPLVLCKRYHSPEKKDQYFHLLVIEDDLTNDILRFVDGYNQHEELVERLTAIHDFVDDAFEKTDRGHRILRTLLLGLNDIRLHQSEIKTLLVISKPFQDHPEIRVAREALLETYYVKRG